MTCGGLRIADKGNLVQFGPNPEDNFIQNAITKRKISIGFCPAGGDDDVKSEVEVMAVISEEDESEDEEGGEVEVETEAERLRAERADGI